MKIQQFLEHHGIATNPFAEEDAQTDPIFKAHCIGRTYHPSWDKIYGDPNEPSTAVVFGEKGSGKTALRLQIVRHLVEHNRQHGDRRNYVIEYDDFNHFLDRFRDRLARRRQRADRVLGEWKLWDHMDAILSLGTTKLADQILGTATGGDEEERTTVQQSLKKLDRWQARDLLLLAACYDQSAAETFRRRWKRLRRKVRYPVLRSRWDLLVGVLVTGLVAAAVITSNKSEWLATPWPYVFAAAGWIPWLVRTTKWFFKARGICRQVRTIPREVNPLRQVLMGFAAGDLAGQPLPNKDRTDDRYELLVKFQGILRTLGFPGIVVLVDRVDEPHLINGSADQMRALLWPMLDNKFLKHPGIGFKLLLPIELAHFIDREDREFYQRARLDKQNMVPSLIWTGEALYDVANDRIKACAAPGATPKLRDFFDSSISDQRLIDALRSLRVPRHLFKFLYRVFVAHTSAYTDENPVWQVASPTFESTLAIYGKDQDAFDRGVGAG